MDVNYNFWLGRTAYQIMPDRFYKEGKETLPKEKNRKLKDWHDRMPDWKPDNDGEFRNLYFYGGNLKGIEAKLQYLKELGFDMIYITPIEKSRSYHHYDVGDHMEIDPWIGTWDDFKSLCESAKKLGIAIVVDLVFNHTGIDSVYFDNPEYQQWYKKTKSGKQIFWWGFKDLPECDTMLEAYQDAMTKVVEKYLENGASGIRLDLGENLPKEFLHAIARVKKKYPYCIFIGEMWEIATDKEDSKIFDGQLDSVMNYPMSDAILRWTRWGYEGHFSYNFNRVYGEYPTNVKNILLNNIATHDTPTTMTMLVGDKMNGNVFDKKIWDIEAPWLQGEQFNTYKFREYEAHHDVLPEEQYVYGKKLLKIALAIMYTIPGIPCVYQGTEIADTGYKDPFNRKPFCWEKQDQDMLEFVRILGKFRKENSDVLATGSAFILQIDNSVLVLCRKTNAGKIIVAVNRSENIRMVNLEQYMKEGKKPNTLLKTNNSYYQKLNPYGIVIVRE